MWGQPPSAVHSSDAQSAFVSAFLRNALTGASFGLWGCPVPVCFTTVKPLSIKTVNLKSDMPRVSEALLRLDHELAQARQQTLAQLKVIHGYGSTGAGGDIRIAVQKRLHALAQSGEIRGCIFGENWSQSDDAAWKLLQSHPELKRDPDLGRRNEGITIVLL